MQDPNSNTPEIKATEADAKTPPVKVAEPDGNKPTPAVVSEPKPEIKQV